MKQLHIACVVISITLFILRAALQFQGKPWRNRMSLRIAPHVVDTVLLGSALWLAFSIHQYPFVNSWLTAKVFGLIAYVVLGMIALRRICTPGVRVVAFCSALLVFSYIVAVAITKSVVPFGN